MDFKVYCGETEIGDAKAQKDGQRLRFYARIPFREGIWRLFVYRADGGTIPLGVLMPKGGELVLDRRITLTDGAENLVAGVIAKGGEPPAPPLGFPPDIPAGNGAELDRWLETPDPAGFTADDVLKLALDGERGALYRYRDGYAELAVPARSHGRVSPVLALTRPETIRGDEYFIIKLGSDGFPLPADGPSTY